MPILSVCENSSTSSASIIGRRQKLLTSIAPTQVCTNITGGFISSDKLNLVPTLGGKSIKKANHLRASWSRSPSSFRLVLRRGSRSYESRSKADRWFSSSSPRMFHGSSIMRSPHERVPKASLRRSLEISVRHNSCPNEHHFFLPFPARARLEIHR